jgi:hypothetical protein
LNATQDFVQVNAPPRAGWRFFFQWVLTTTVGLGIGHLAAVFSGLIAGGDFDYLGLLFLHALFGAGIGVAQWLILKRHVHRAGLWIPSSIAGWCVIWPVAFLLSGSNSPSADCFIAAVAIGLASLLVMRGRWFQNLVYVLACWVGWSAAFLSAICLWILFHPQMLSQPPGPPWQEGAAFTACGVVAGVVFALITGWPVVWMLRGHTLDSPGQYGHNQ